jgi:hypothetical protein
LQMEISLLQKVPHTKYSHKHIRVGEHCDRWGAGRAQKCGRTHTCSYCIRACLRAFAQCGLVCV